MRQNARVSPLASLIEDPVHRDERDRELLWIWLDGLMATLPENQRAAIEGHVDGVSDTVIANETGLTPATVRVLRCRGMRTLRRLATVSRHH